ncbi:MAG: glycerol-3-phosphate cytidylyltransferase [Clostridia bacterium]|nr:glycerol-3-phosphate cytidylyltransferase [Clostridia bacterium]
MKRILTYGTFDLLHYGHIRLLKRAKELGDYLIVAISTDEFNAIKQKKAYHNYQTRKEMLEAVRYVDLVIPEESWEQKINDVKTYNVDVVVMGDDWAGNEKFEELKDYCDVVYLERTKGVSTTQIKRELGLQKPVNGVNQIPEPSKNLITNKAVI